MFSERDGRHDDGLVRDATLDGGGLLIYDTVSEGAWIQSDVAVDVTDFG